MSLAEDYAACRQIARLRGANFSVGLRLLPPAKRSAADAVYAFCRFADDIADEDAVARMEGGPASVLDRLEAWEKELDRVYFGTPSTPIGRALADSVRRYPIPAEPFRLLIEGGRRDQSKTRYESEEEFLDYCRLVAWTIADLTLPIFGFREDRARRWGRELSTALQRTNVLRDVGEDAERGRIYLPRDAREQHGVREEDLRRRRATPGFLALMSEEIERTRGSFRRAEPILSAVDADARLCVGLLGGVYLAVLDRIARRPAVALEGKASLTRAEKFALVARAALRVPRGRWP